MQNDRGSSTAVSVAMLRAVHQLIDPGNKLLTDEPILKFLPPELMNNVLEHPEQYNSQSARSLRSHVLIRSRYAEDCLREACLLGIRQYIMLGTGLDTFAYRQPDWANQLRIFELDHPASQKDKQFLLSQATISIPDNLTFIPIDLEKDNLATSLKNTGFDFKQPAFISCLGVMPYLRPSTNDKIFQFAASLLPSSELVFTFSQRDPPGIAHELAEKAAAKGEPWLTRVDLPELERTLVEFGFSDLKFLSPREIKQRYFSDPTIDLPLPRRMSIARAIV